MYPLRVLFLFAVVSTSACGPGGSGSGDLETLRSLHARILKAHLERDAEGWTALEGDTVIVGNRGNVFRSGRSERLEMRRRYFNSVRFSAYRDLQPPIIRIARDGSQAWLLANVDVVAHPVSGDVADSTHTVWTWVELYEKRANRWEMVGNVSNERPGSTP